MREDIEKKNMREDFSEERILRKGLRRVRSREKWISTRE